MNTVRRPSKRNRRHRSAKALLAFPIALVMTVTATPTALASSWSHLGYQLSGEASAAIYYGNENTPRAIGNYISKDVNELRVTDNRRDGLWAWASLYKCLNSSCTSKKYVARVMARGYDYPPAKVSINLPRWTRVATRTCVSSEPNLSSLIYCSGWYKTSVL